MICSRPWHNLAGRTGIRAQAFMPHTSLLHIFLSLRLRHQEGFGNRFPTYFMLACLDEVSEWKLVHPVWALLMPVHSSAEFELSSKFAPSLDICCLSNCHADVTTLAVDEDLKDSYPWEMICKYKNNATFTADPFSFWTLWYYYDCNDYYYYWYFHKHFLCYQFYSVSNRWLTKRTYLYRKTKQK